ncbi:hypothetical protein F3J16_35285, partial [Burkholderia sp. Ap-962]
MSDEAGANAHSTGAARRRPRDGFAGPARAAIIGDRCAPPVPRSRRRIPALATRKPRLETSMIPALIPARFRARAVASCLGFGIACA